MLQAKSVYNIECVNQESGKSPKEKKKKRKRTSLSFFLSSLPSLHKLSQCLGICQDSILLTNFPVIFLSSSSLSLQEWIKKVENIPTFKSLVSIFPESLKKEITFEFHKCTNALAVKMTLKEDNKTACTSQRPSLTKGSATSSTAARRIPAKIARLASLSHTSSLQAGNC